MVNQKLPDSVVTLAVAGKSRVVVGEGVYCLESNKTEFAVHLLKLSFNVITQLLDCVIQVLSIYMHSF